MYEPGVGFGYLSYHSRAGEEFRWHLISRIKMTMRNEYLCQTRWDRYSLVQLSALGFTFYRSVTRSRKNPVWVGRGLATRARRTMKLPPEVHYNNGGSLILSRCRPYLRINVNRPCREMLPSDKGYTLSQTPNTSLYKTVIGGLDVYNKNVQWHNWYPPNLCK